MMLFWLIGAVAAAAVVAWMLRPLLTRKTAAPPSRASANVAIYRDQLRELDSDLAAGTLAPEDYQRARAELEARALRDAGQPDAPAAQPPDRPAVEPPDRPAGEPPGGRLARTPPPARPPPPAGPP